VIDAVSLAVTASGAELLSLVIGGSVVAAMLIARRVAPRIPIALLAMIVALIASVAFDLQAFGVTVLGPVAAGLPSISVPYASPAELVGLIPGALGLAVLSFADTTVTGRSFAARHGERTDANRELVALAAAAAAGGVTGGYPVSSSPSRTSAGEAAGSTSQMTGVIAAAAVAVVLVLLTGPLAFLPIPALGGVIFVAVLGLIDVVGIRSIWALKRSEGLIALTAAGGVILYGTLTGVVIAVLLAALNIVRRSAWPEIVEEGRLPDGTWRDPERSDAAVRVEGVLVLRFAGPLFFANVGALEARIREAVASQPDIRVVILDLAATADIDLTAGQALRGVADSLERDGRRLAVAEPIGRVRDELRAYGLERLMAPSGGTHGSVDAVIVGAGLDPLRPMRGPAPQPAALTGPPEADAPSEPSGTSPDRVAWQTVGAAAVAVVLAVAIAAVRRLGSRAGNCPERGTEPHRHVPGACLGRGGGGRLRTGSSDLHASRRSARRHGRGPGAAAGHADGRRILDPADRQHRQRAGRRAGRDRADRGAGHRDPDGSRPHGPADRDGRGRRGAGRVRRIDHTGRRESRRQRDGGLVRGVERACGDADADGAADRRRVGSLDPSRRHHRRSRHRRHRPADGTSPSPSGPSPSAVPEATPSASTVPPSPSGSP
jgi:anti-anti-sigma regulatory factor